MATFIQGDPGLKLDPVLYTPDYNFLRYVLQKKTGQYEQGLKSVSGVMGTLKKELSDPTNVERRDTYMKSAEAQLQKISSADLSLQQNVNAANAIFDPIVSDSAIMFDSYHTSNNRKQLAAMDSWASSDDMATRKKFNKDIYDWVQRDLDSLKTGNGDINSYKVQGRKAWAYVDSQDLINNAAKEMGFKVENDELGKPYIVTTVGGKTNRENYELFANSVLAANPVYQQQLSILGQAKTEKDIYAIKQSNPAYANLSRLQLLEISANQGFDKGEKRQKEYLEDLDRKMALQKADANAYAIANAAKIKANAQSEEAQIAAKKSADLEAYRTQINNLRSDYHRRFGSDEQSTKERKETFLKSFLDNPEGYYARQTEMEDVVRWSNTRSAFGTKSIKPDQAYISMANLEDKTLNTLNNIKDDQIDNQRENTELALKLQGKTSTGERKKNADGSDKLSDVEFVDISNVQVNTTTRVKQLQDRLAMSKAAGIQNMTGTFGGLYLLEKMGTSPEDVALIRQTFTRKEMDGSYATTKEEKAAMNKAYENLYAFAKLNNQEGVLSALRTQIDNKDKELDVDLPGLLRAAVKNYEPKDDYEDAAIRQLVEYEKNQAEIKRISGSVQKGLDIVIGQIKNDKSFDNVLVVENGKKRLITDDDVFKRLPSTGWKEDIDWSIDPATSLSEDERKNISKGIFNGSVKVDVQSFVQGGGKTGLNSGFTNRTTIDYQGRKLYIETPSLIAPSSEELSKKLKQINERVPIPEFESAIDGVGVSGSAVFVVRNDMAEKVGTLLSGSTETNSNIKQSVGGSMTDFADVPPKDQQAIRDAMADKSNVTQVKIFTTSPMNEGKQVVEVKFASSKSKDNPDKWAGQTYYFPINISARSADLFKLFADVDDMDEFSQYSKQNKPYIMDHHEASGVKAMIVSDQPGSKTGTVRVYSKYDPNTKTYTDNWIEQPPIPFDLNRVTFTEIKNQVYSNAISPYVQRRRAYNKQVQGTQAGSGVDFYNKLISDLNR